MHVDWICLIMVGLYTQTDISKQMIIILYWAAKQQQEKWWCNYILTHSHHYFNDRSYFCDYHKMLQLLMMSKLMWWYFLLLIASIKMRYLSFVIKWELFYKVTVVYFKNEVITVKQGHQRPCPITKMIFWCFTFTPSSGSKRKSDALTLRNLIAMRGENFSH